MKTTMSQIKEIVVNEVAIIIKESEMTLTADGIFDLLDLDSNNGDMFNQSMHVSRVGNDTIVVDPTNPGSFISFFIKVYDDNTMIVATTPDGLSGPKKIVYKGDAGTNEAEEIFRDLL